MTYRVTAEDGSFEDYVVTATVAAIDAKDILSFRIPGQSGSVISGTDITVTVPFGTDKTSLTPAIIHTGVSINPEIAVAQDFSSLVAYTVTDGAGITKVYSVTVKIWAKTFGGTYPDSAKSVCTDPSGNIYITGSFSVVVNFGGGDVTANGTGVMVDGFIAKYAPDGTFLWAKKIGGMNNSDTSNSICTDSSGNVYVTGEFSGQFDFGGGEVNATSYHQDMFLVKYAPDGTFIWVKTSTGFGREQGKSVCIGSSGNVFVTGTFSQTGNFGSGDVTSNGGNDIFVVSYSSDGTYKWSKTFGGTGDDDCHSVYTDSLNNVYATGSFRNTVNFGGSDVTSNGLYDGFVIKYSSVGVFQWAKNFGGLNSESFSTMGVDSSDNIYVAGNLIVSSSNAGIFIVKYTSNGTYVWDKSFVGNGYVSYYDTSCMDSTGNFYITGTYTGTMDFGGGNLTGTGTKDVFIAKYDANGVNKWSKTFGSSGIDEGYSIFTNSTGNVYVTGIFSGALNLGDGSLNYSGNGDVFLVNVLNQ